MTAPLAELTVASVCLCSLVALAFQFRKSTDGEMDQGIRSRSLWR